jgi:DNA processing protein
MLQDLGLLELNFTNDRKVENKFESKEEELIYSHLSGEPLHIDSLPHLTNLEISEILVKLLEMEFNGLVRQLPGKYYVRFA